VVDLGVGELLGRAEESVAGVGDDDVDTPEPLERPSAALVMVRTVPTTRSPRASSCSVSSWPKPLETAVMSQERVTA
jgi:hypothetical protein